MLPGLERTWKKDTILTFWEVRPSQMDVQFEARCQVAKVMLPGMERTCQKDKILTFCEVRPAPGMPRSMQTGKLVKAEKVLTRNFNFLLLVGEAHLKKRQNCDFLASALAP